MTMPPTIHITIHTQYVPEQSNPADNRYFFAYNINIKNNGDESIQLLYRHWIITNGDNHIEEVRGEGVVGEQPHIAPNDAFEYTSGALLATPVGSMKGSYRMITESGQVFEAPIPRFTLSQPNAIN